MEGGGRSASRIAVVQHAYLVKVSDSDARQE